MTRDKFIAEMEGLLFQYGVDADTIEAVLREFYESHSFSKYSVLAIFRDAILAGVLGKATNKFLERKKSNE